MKKLNIKALYESDEYLPSEEDLDAVLNAEEDDDEFSDDDLENFDFGKPSDYDPFYGLDDDDDDDEEDDDLDDKIKSKVVPGFTGFGEYDSDNDDDWNDDDDDWNDGDEFDLDDDDDDDDDDFGGDFDEEGNTFSIDDDATESDNEFLSDFERKHF